MSESALLAYAGDLRWRDLCAATGVAASEQRDAEGHRVYASFYYVEVGGLPAEGLALFGPDDRLEVVGTLSRYGRSMLDGVHRLYAAGRLGATLPQSLPEAPYVRLSNVFVREARGPDDLRVTSHGIYQQGRPPRGQRSAVHCCQSGLRQGIRRPEWWPASR